LYRPEPISSFDQAPGGPRSSDKVLVVIPCLNERTHIGRLVDEVVQDSASLDVLVAVADGGSTDGTLEAVRTIANADPRVRVISNVKRIQSAGVNLAARTLGEGRRWLVRIDAHADYPKGYISRLIQEASCTGAASVVVAMTSRGDACFQRAAAVAQRPTGPCAKIATLSPKRSPEFSIAPNPVDMMSVAKSTASSLTSSLRRCAIERVGYSVSR